MGSRSLYSSPKQLVSARAVSEYSVLAKTPEDFSATVKFAADHNLRLVVKGTGHDWYGRSTAAGSLLLWTHLRKGITFHDSFVAEGCDASTSVPAATVESGVQFMDLYPDAWNHGKIFMGGTCDSVGVGGCWSAGCYVRGRACWHSSDSSSPRSRLSGESL
jgi:FAD/FMN-containing dehydrogenase